MIVALEGIDGSGKTSLGNVLKDALQQNGVSVGLWQFSADAPCLARCAHDLLSQGPTGRYYALHAMFAGARLTKLSYFLKPEHAVVLVDRYKYSTQVYGVCQGLAEEWCMALEAPLPEAALVLLLDVPIEVAMLRKQRPDELEQDARLQQAVRARYLHRARGDVTWCVLDASAPRDDVLDRALGLILAGMGASGV